MKQAFLILIVFLTGCAVQPVEPIIKPMPSKKCINIPNEGCKKISAGNIGGTTLGNRDEIIIEEISR